MTFLRRLLPAFVAAAVIVAGPAAIPAFGARDYRGVVDITFPTAARARYSNDFANGRSGGRVHRATDVFVRAGAPIRAARGGTVIWLPQYESGNAGFAIQILGDDGRTYAYYHLGRAGGRYRDAISRKLALGRRVSRGQYLGRMGDSGNAAGTPHLHFEIHDNAVQDPYGSNRVNPYGSLRRAQGLPIGDRGPAANPIATGSKALRMGSRGRAVVIWQRKLNRTRTTSKLVTDGVFGPGTQSATITFQNSAGLGPAGLGVVGPKTRAAMRYALNRGAAQAAPKTAPEPKPRKSARAKPAPTKRAPAKKPARVRTAGLLRLGDSGRTVKIWQRKLNRSGRVGRLAVDGAFGAGTHRATVRFQKSVGLGPVGLGVVGPKTRAAMKRVLH